LQGMKVFYSILVLLFAANISMAKMRSFLPFPTDFSPIDFCSVNDGYVAVYGYFSRNDKRYFSILASDVFSSTGKSKWYSSTVENDLWPRLDSAFTEYYNQLFIFKSDPFNGMGYLFDYSLNYILFNPSSSSNYALDSIQQAYSINDLITCKDTLLYASFVNNDSNFIARKKGLYSKWENVPIIVAHRETSNTLQVILTWIIVLFGIIATYLFWRLTTIGKRVEKALANNEVYNNNLKLAADRPLDYNQITNKDTKDAINAIVEVIQNRNTPLPMTIAINGAWGSGKSTIMNCIRQKLDIDSEKRFITTWFNAWHQQSESSLLNAFLLKIVNRYEQPFFKKNSWKAAMAFIRFRLKLASSRFIKWSFYNQLLSGFALTFLFLFACILVANLYSLEDAAFFKWAGLPNIRFRSMFPDGSLKSYETGASIIAVVLSVVSFFILRSESAPTIGAFLNVMYKKSFLVEAEKNTPDLREKFRTQYWEIMEAIEDRVLIVFIDDLDRVTGDKIFEMLEAINFISDATSRPDDSDNRSLKTIFVLGLYVDQVAEQLGIFLQKEDPYSEKSDEKKGKQEAIRLGKKYLEKMIQLNVPVPLTNQNS
jgi:hypothetical protein